MNWIKAAAAALALALSSHANAQAKEAGWYIGGSLGQSELKDWCQGVTVSCDAKDSSWRFFGGYQINRHLSPNFSVRGEWQRYLDAGGRQVGGETDIDVLSLGALFRF